MRTSTVRCSKSMSRRRSPNNSPRRNPARADGRVNTYLRSLVERDTAAAAADLAWLDRLIAEERATVPVARAGVDTEPGGKP